MDLDLKNLHVLITGASGGIGLETTSVFLQQGARVTAHYNSKRYPLEPLLSQWPAEQLQALQADLTKEDAVARLFSDAVATFGVVQVVVINHAIYFPDDTPLQNMSLERWTGTFDANVTSSFLVAREYLRYLEKASEEEKAKANVIVIGSSAGRWGEQWHAEYAASKSALMYGFVLTLKNEIVKIAKWGRVNCVSPGWVKTPMAEESLKDPSILYKAMATYPLRKVATPFDVANQVVIMASTKVSGHITGENITVAGGMEGRLLNTREDLGL
ncbi:NAD-P-binding protein [Cylindrobasidium torrendii FP15055 ss-10]|uniref:NAD-P-binding protein n=1 Tax=Cylindrobasidium torrendii FP15055 ss-10 TaxID=1314674 RepID=A0A0D7BEC3_9AGAR|nr:NAD-P-binding protein [Cylindrobasidium torrendii FP15055 ss-10]